MDSELKHVNTYKVKVFIAGDIQNGKNFCREYFSKKGWCCTINPTTYIYTGGEEQGYVIGFINYGRFPSTNEKILTDVLEFADGILHGTFQKSCSVVADDVTYYLENKNIPKK